MTKKEEFQMGVLCNRKECKSWTFKQISLFNICEKNLVQMCVTNRENISPKQSVILMVFGEIHLSICGPPGDGSRVTEFSQNHPKEMKKYFPELLGFLHQFWKVRVRAFLLFTLDVINVKALKEEQSDAARWNRFIEQGLCQPPS